MVIASRLLVFGGMSTKGFVSADLYELEVNQERVKEMVR